MEMKQEYACLKNGKELLIRSPIENDAKSMVEYLLDISKETHFLIRYGEEISCDMEEEKKFIQNVVQDKDSVMIVACDGKRIVGSVSIFPIGKFYKVRHRCSLSIAIRKEYCSLGLGRILMNKVLFLAKEKGYEQVELGVLSDNIQAIDLYQSIGFMKCGSIPHAFHLKNRAYIDEETMVLFLGKM